MDKIKIIKLLVICLTFCLLFVLCLLVNKVMLKNTEKTFEIKIETVDKEQITDIKTAENLLHVVTSENKIYVFDVKKGAYKGSIYFVKE